MSYLESLKKLINPTEPSEQTKIIHKEDKDKLMRESYKSPVVNETKEQNMATTYLGPQDMYGQNGFRRINTFSSLFDNVDNNKIKDGRYHYFWQHQYFKGSSKLGKKVSIKVEKDTIPEGACDSIDIIQNPVLIVKGDALKELGSVDKNNLLERLIIKKCELEIGGQRIDKVWGLQNYFFNQVLGNDMYDELNKNVAETGVLYIPLAFDMLWNDSYVPINCLRYHDFIINIEFEHETGIQNHFGLDYDEWIENEELVIDYQLKLDGIVLSPEHRKEMVQKSHEHLIKAYQYNGRENMTRNLFNHSVKINLGFNHPCMGILIYFTSYKESFINQDLFDYVELRADGKTILQMDGDILKCDGFYHMGLKNTDKLKGYYWLPFNRINDRLNKKHDLMSYSTINMSRIDKATLIFKFKKKKEQLEWPIPDTDHSDSYWGKVFHGGVTMHCYALNSHVLRNMAGMTGLAFSK